MHRTPANHMGSKVPFSPLIPRVGRDETGQPPEASPMPGEEIGKLLSPSYQRGAPRTTSHFPLQGL